jgi:hypothetical protein
MTPVSPEAPALSVVVVTPGRFASLGGSLERLAVFEMDRLQHITRRDRRDVFGAA